MTDPTGAFLTLIGVCCAYPMFFAVIAFFAGRWVGKRSTRPNTYRAANGSDPFLKQQ